MLLGVEDQVHESYGLMMIQYILLRVEEVVIEDLNFLEGEHSTIQDLLVSEGLQCGMFVFGEVQ